MSELPKTTQERIKADAKHYTKDEGYQMAYIAGATAEAERAQCLVDALEAFILWQGSTLKNWLVMKQAHEALQQWKEGKEVGNG